MYKYNNAKVAKESAQEHSLHYGMSALDGKWYVGSVEELKKAGCADIDKSETKISKALEIVNNLSEEVDEDVIIKELVAALGVEFEEEIRGSFKSGEGRYGSFGDAGEFTSEGVEYNWIASEDEAERIALEIVKNDLESEPEIFNQEWLQHYMSITDTDKRMMASEEADRRVEDMDDEEVVKEGGFEDEYAEAKRVGDKRKMGVIIDNARDNVLQAITDEMESKLDDPIGYFVDEQGIYTVQDLMKQPWISIDTEEAAQSAVDTDGWAHFLSRYSGDYETTKSGIVYFREN